MIYFLISIIGILLTIFFVVGTHEAAHFAMARLLGIKVLRFSIGFGKKLWSWQDKSGTEYVLALIPLGGYVKMLDENEGTVSEKERPHAFNRQPFYKKFLVVLAGPFVNILCALLLYWVVFMVGFVTVKPIIGTIAPRSIAAESGLKNQQEIIRIDNKTTATWTGVMFRLLAHAGDHDQLTLTVKDMADNTISSHVLALSNWHIGGLTPDPLLGLGITPYQPTIPLIIGYMGEGSPATTSPLKMGDKIIAINHMKIHDWDQLIKTIMGYADKTLTFTVEREGSIQDLAVRVGAKRTLLLQKYGYLGIGPHVTLPAFMLSTVKYSPLLALTHAWNQIVDFTYFNLLLFEKILVGKISLQSLGGPITIFESAGEALNSGFLSFISFLAFLSISIGVINLVPIPGLDGGHLFIYIIELIIRRPVPEKMLEICYRIGFMFLIFILFTALVNDVLRL